MSESTSKFARPSDGHPGGPTQGQDESTGNPAEWEWLDREHQARVTAVAKCDTERGRDASAKNAIGLLTEETQELYAMRNSQGSEEHVEACGHCRWFPYQHVIKVGARMAWLLDSVLWIILWGGLWWLWLKYFKDSHQEVPGWLYFPGGIAVPVLGIFCARIAKGFGQHAAVSRLTNPDSADDTIDRQVRFAGKAAVAAGVFLLSILALLFFSPPSWSSWATYASSLVGFAANIALGLSAGIGGNAAQLLGKSAERDAIDCQIEMKERTRRHLRKFLLGLLLALAGSFGSAHAAADAPPVKVVAIDFSLSVDSSQRDAGIEAMLDTAFDRAQALGIRFIQVIRFSNDLLLADMSWVPVPIAPIKEDCDKALPGFVVSEGLAGLSPSVAVAQRQEAVAACVARQDAALRTFSEELTRFRERLRLATIASGRGAGPTRIVSLLKKLVARPYVRAIDVITDGIDNSGVPLSTLRIPANTTVTLVITRPDPQKAKPTLDEVLAAADAWAQVQGVSVTSVSEYPGFVHSAEGQ